jgi:hypothetical protein
MRLNEMAIGKILVEEPQGDLSFTATAENFA